MPRRLRFKRFRRRSDGLGWRGHGWRWKVGTISCRSLSQICLRWGLCHGVNLIVGWFIHWEMRRHGAGVAQERGCWGRNDMVLRWQVRPVLSLMDIEIEVVLLVIRKGNISPTRGRIWRWINGATVDKLRPNVVIWMIAEQVGGRGWRCGIPMLLGWVGQQGLRVPIEDSSRIIVESVRRHFPSPFPPFPPISLFLLRRLRVLSCALVREFRRLEGLNRPSSILAADMQGADWAITHAKEAKSTALMGRPVRKNDGEGVLETSWLDAQMRTMSSTYMYDWGDDGEGQRPRFICYCRRVVIHVPRSEVVLKASTCQVQSPMPVSDRDNSLQLSVCSLRDAGDAGEKNYVVWSGPSAIIQSSSSASSTDSGWLEHAAIVRTADWSSGNRMAMTMQLSFKQAPVNLFRFLDDQQR